MNNWIRKERLSFSPLSPPTPYIFSTLLIFRGIEFHHNFFKNVSPLLPTVKMNEQFCVRANKKHNLDHFVFTHLYFPPIPPPICHISRLLVPIFTFTASYKQSWARVIISASLFHQKRVLRWSNNQQNCLFISCNPRTGDEGEQWR